MTKTSNNAFKTPAELCENLYSNVDSVIHDQLVSKMKDGLTFTEDGCIIGYRGAKTINAMPVAEENSDV